MIELNEFLNDCLKGKFFSLCWKILIPALMLCFTILDTVMFINFHHET